jgi:hypothetical protein
VNILAGPMPPPPPPPWWEPWVCFGCPIVAVALLIGIPWAFLYVTGPKFQSRLGKKVIKQDGSRGFEVLKKNDEGK